MRNWTVLPLAAAALLALPSAAMAHDTGQAVHPDETTPIELSQGPVELVAHHFFGEGTDMQFQRREGKQHFDGAVIDATKDFVYVGGDAKSDPEYGGIHIFDITDPTLPRHIADVQCRGYHADMAVYENYLFQAFDSGGSNSGCTEEAAAEFDPDGLDRTGAGVRVYDITDPANPRVIGFLDNEGGIGTGGSHNITIVPWAGLLYLAQAGIANPQGIFRIVDLNDPSFPVTEIPMQTVAPGAVEVCHDIGLDPERELAYCAAIGSTHVLDISDPMSPSLVSTLRSDSISIHHSARLSGDGQMLVLGDEHAGAADVNTPQLDSLPLQSDTGVGAQGCLGSPTAGALFFYDIATAGPAAPILRGSFAPTNVQPIASPCTAHFYGSVTDSSYVVAGWYEGGIVVADYSQPWPLNEYAVFLPELGNFWSAYWWHGYVYGASRTIEDKGFGGGLWVVKVEGLEDAEPAPGDEGTVWGRWTSQVGGPVAAPAPEPAPVPTAVDAAPAAEELPATGGGFALLSVLLGAAYLGLRWRDGLARTGA